MEKKYHINNKGEAKRCFAFFGDCKYETHIPESQLKDYMDQYDSSRISHSKLLDEKILRPEKHFTVGIKEFSNKSLLKDIEYTDDSFVALVSEPLSENGINEYMKKQLDERKIPLNQIGRASMVLGDIRYINITDDQGGRTYLGRLWRDNGDFEKINDFFTSHLGEIYPMLYDKTRDATQTVMAFGYVPHDVYVDKNTVLRVFVPPKELEYDFSEEKLDKKRR